MIRWQQVKGGLRPLISTQDPFLDILAAHLLPVAQQAEREAAAAATGSTTL
eukprot:CAMPEP_0180664110 /NCGR_PEP_ID=MMETSP1037_2-20121125/60413_1 /TAXON_ID=632150 /ORGANISM="Azadinium spinosum, Strain 3D9" /LENGTH=50 /DNA_ID=CAMNT_0022692143 /DNA_START=764 /DNA_END=913 /DNA_ORIENTATION=-